MLKLEVGGAAVELRLIKVFVQEPEDRLLQSAPRGPAGPERLLRRAAAQQVSRSALLLLFCFYDCLIIYLN